MAAPGQHQQECRPSESASRGREPLSFLPLNRQSGWAFTCRAPAQNLLMLMMDSALEAPSLQCLKDTDEERSSSVRCCHTVNACRMRGRDEVAASETCVHHKRGWRRGLEACHHLLLGSGKGGWRKGREGVGTTPGGQEKTVSQESAWLALPSH